MIPAWDYNEVCCRLANAFRHRYPGGNVHMVGLLFAPPHAPLAKEEIVRSLDYFHHRSKNHIDFFCAGYSRCGITSGERPVTSDDSPWVFSNEAFERFRRDIERRSRWQYSGETDLLLMNGRRGNDEESAYLDFSSAVVCDLERMKQDGAIHSVRRFLEGVFRFAESVTEPDPTWGFSDEMGVWTARSALTRVILSLLPNYLSDVYREAEHFTICDLSNLSYDRKSK